MKPFAVADAETDPFKFGRSVKPFLWGYYNGRIYRAFCNTGDFVKFVRKQDVILYAHNGGKFDWRLLESYLDEGPVKIISGRLAEAKMGKATLRDSYSLLPASLDAITGKKQEIDYRKFEATRRRHHMDEIKEYLHQDCVILYEALERFFNEYGRPLTLAGATLRQWRKMGGEIPKFGPSHFAQFEPFYHGGRCQAIKPGTHTGKLFFIDLNSAYAFAMSHKQWHGQAAPASKMPARYYERGLFHITCESFGAFPFRTDTSLTFPHGYGEFHVTGRELAAALDLRLCRDVKIIRCYRFTQWTSFAEYVAHFQQLRREAKAADDKLGDSMAKLFGNGIYGKMAANPNKYKNWYLTRLGGKPDKAHADYRPDGILTNAELWSKPLEDYQKTFYDVTLGAQITGHVRTIMMRALAEVTDPLYCDTDSIICRNTASLKLDDKELGAWKIEAMGTEAIIAGKKLYAFKYAKKQKGKTHKVASKGAKLTVAQIKKIARGEEVIYRQAAQSYGLHGVRNIERRIRRTAK